jgi:catechol 2,3-dioxygenase-like lactoylglutathione lyase family enzyme
MKIRLNSVFVDDQDKALAFYTEVLGFATKTDFPVGRFRWITVVSPEESDGAELLLEPNDNPAARAYQKAIFEQGIAATAFLVENIEEEYARLKALGVTFTVEPTATDGPTIAVLDDTCGNLIQLYEV